MGILSAVKTTVDIQEMFVLAAQGRSAERYEPPDCSVGDASATNPLESWSSQDLRDEIYAEPTQR